MISLVIPLFAQVFTVLEVRNFTDIISVRMQTLFTHMAENQAMLTIPQHFLANSNISKQFAEILLNFLVGPSQPSCSLRRALFNAAGQCPRPLVTAAIA